MQPTLDRRQFLESATSKTTTLLTPLAVVSLSSTSSAERQKPAAPAQHQLPDLARQVGIVTASAQIQLTGKAKGRRFTLLELPRILRDELDIRVIDLNTSSIPNFATVSKQYLDQMRAAADKAGCRFTNLKMNQRGIDMNSPDKESRRRAMTEYKRSIDVAAHLGCHWARPLPSAKKPDMALHIAAYRELCDYAAERKVQMLVENFGWMQSDVASVETLIKAIGHNVAAGVDTGNWNSNALRYQGLERSFPLAATCDFKARKMGPQGEHPLYDLKRCFQIAWESGFRGPWCLEHANADTEILIRELRFLRSRLRRWMVEAKKGKD